MDVAAEVGACVEEILGTGLFSEDEADAIRPALAIFGALVAGRVLAGARRDAGEEEDSRRSPFFLQGEEVCFDLGRAR